MPLLHVLFFFPNYYCYPPTSPNCRVEYVALAAARAAVAMPFLSTRNGRRLGQGRGMCLFAHYPSVSMAFWSLQPQHKYSPNINYYV
eukprot:6210342-Amphidinium_carterae.1